MDKKNDKIIEVKMKIVEVKKLNYFEYPLETLKIEKLNILDIPFDLNLNMGINNKEGIMDFILTVHFYQKIKDEKVILFGIKTSHKFQIFDFENTFKKDKEGRILLDNGILSSLLSIAISGTRGMLSLLNTSDEYKEILLPILNPMDLLNNINQAKN